MTIEGDLKKIAWWLLAEFHPYTTEVRGIPVSQIRKNWCKATEFRKDLFPNELIVVNGTDEMEEAKLSFALEGHFDGTPTAQIALVGVYEECSGQRGRFILVLDQPAGTNRKAKIRFVSAVPTDRPFGVLSQGEDNSIAAWACMACDNRAILKWDRKKRKFDWLHEPDDE